MVQMESADLAIIKAIAGNDRCADCGMKSPQWASVSFGTIFCLECSGVHRSLGVHISFVRSIAMDSWTQPQLALMKSGGNAACAKYLKDNGLNLKSPIKEKYESPVAQLYKEILKAKVEGRPAPTSLPTPAPRRSGSSASVGKPGEDPNGMERLTGESDKNYIARQTKLREQARVRMASKFGGGGGPMGGVGGGGMSSGGGGGKMAGIGSDSSYNPNSGGYGGAGKMDMNLDGVMSGFGMAFSTLGSAAKSGMSQAQAALNDQKSREDLTGSLKYTGNSLWSSLKATGASVTTAASQLATNLAEPDGDGGLSSLQQKFRTEKETRGMAGPSKYSGFGSDTMTGQKSNRGSFSNGEWVHVDDQISAAKNSSDNLNYSSNNNAAAPAPQQQRNAMPKRTSPPSSAGSAGKPVVKKLAGPVGDDFFNSFGA